MPLESSFLVPDLGFMVAMVVTMTLMAAVFLGPLVMAIRERDVVWAVVIAVSGSVGGLAWIGTRLWRLVGRRRAQTYA